MLKSFLTRRSLLRAAPIVAAGAVTGATEANAKAAPFSLDRFPVFLAAHQYGDDTVSQFCYQGRLIACPDGAQSFTITSVQGFSHQRATLLPDGRMKLSLTEVGYYGDPDSDAIPETLTNPSNGATMRPRHYRTPAAETTVSADGSIASPRIAGIPGARYHGTLTAPLQSGDFVFFSEELNVQLPGKDGGPARAMTSLANYTARLADLQARRAFVPLVFDYCSVGGFADWLGMAGAPGVQVMRLSGRKLRPGELPPAALTARIRADHPGFIENGGI